MYDLIKIRMYTKEPVYKRLPNIITESDPYGRISYKTNINHLSFRQNDNEISINGSFPKYYYNTNACVLNRVDTKYMIEQLSDYLSVNIGKANVCQIEITNNLIMKYSIGLYLDSLGSLRYFKCMNMENETKYYINSLQKVTFYDKTKELKNKRKIVPEIYYGRNVLRYEMRIKKRMSNYFNMNEIKMEDLYSFEFYSKALSAWQSTYFDIEKVKKVKPNNKYLTNAKNLEIYLAAEGLKALGYNEVQSIIMLHKIETSKSNHHRLMKKLKSIAETPFCTETKDVIQELDKKIKYCAESYI